MADTKWIDVDHYLFKFMNPTPKYIPDRPLHMGNYKSSSVITKTEQQQKKSQYPWFQPHKRLLLNVPTNQLARERQLIFFLNNLCSDIRYQVTTFTY